MIFLNMLHHLMHKVAVKMNHCSAPHTFQMNVMVAVAVISDKLIYGSILGRVLIQLFFGDKLVQVAVDRGVVDRLTFLCKIV